MVDDFQAKSDAFMAWLRRAPAQISGKIALADLRQQGCGRGVVATADIAADELLFSVPRTAILCATNSDIPKLLPAVFAELDPWLSLILVMLYEYLRGDRSAWKPYFDVLPVEFNTLMFWTPAELDELQASAVRGKIGKEEADESFYETILPALRENPTIFFPDGGREMTNPELVALAHRMGSTIMAYAFDIEPDPSLKELDEEGYASEEEDEFLPKGMVPLADMLNADAHRNNARLFYERETLTMKALKPIKRGEEIFNDYGSLPRSDLLRRYGYITANYAQFDVVEISPELVVETARVEMKLSKTQIEERLAYLDEHEALDSGYDVSRASNAEADTFPAELLVLVTALQLPAADFQRLKTRGKIPKPHLTPTVAAFLERVLARRSKQYPTTLEQDRQHAGQGRSEQRQEMALAVRLGEKEILEETAAVLRQLIFESSERIGAEAGPAHKKRRMA